MDARLPRTGYDLPLYHVSNDPALVVDAVRLEEIHSARPPRRPLPHTREDLSEAAWWLTRWVSGSMSDPDWDESGTMFDVSRAFEILRDAVGNVRAMSKPSLWRTLSLPGAVADVFEETGELAPWDGSPFQSFTRRRSLAVEFGEEGAQSGCVTVLVEAEPATADVMFGMADLRACRLPEIASVLGSVDNWHHQDEVIVRVTSPLRLKSIEVGRTPGNIPTAPSPG